MIVLVFDVLFLPLSYNNLLLSRSLYRYFFFRIAMYICGTTGDSESNIMHINFIIYYYFMTTGKLNILILINNYTAHNNIVQFTQ